MRHRSRSLMCVDKSRGFQYQYAVDTKHSCHNNGWFFGAIRANAPKEKIQSDGNRIVDSKAPDLIMICREEKPNHIIYEALGYLYNSCRFMVLQLAGNFRSQGKANTVRQKKNKQTKTVMNSKPTVLYFYLQIRMFEINSKRDGRFCTVRTRRHVLSSKVYGRFDGRLP